MSHLQPLLFSLAHSLWQAVLIAGLLWVFLRLVPQRYVRVRYVATVGALLLILFAACATWSLQYHPLTWPVRTDVFVHHEIAGRSAPLAVNHGVSLSRQGIENACGIATPSHTYWNWPLLLTSLWLAGVVAMLLRTTILLARASKLAALGTPTTLPAVEELANKMHLRGGRALRVLVSPLYRVPAVVGTWSPMLLMPAAILAEMPPEQLRLIIAHELAHMRRWDFLVNLMQQVIEALLFFNPAVWWISGQIRQEREACCDALAVSCAGSPELMAHTLADVAAATLNPRQSQGLTDIAAAALALTGHGPLWQRIARLVNPTTPVRIGFPLRSLALGLFVSTLLLALLVSTAELTVRAAEKILTPVERVEKMTELEKKHRPYRLGEPREQPENVTLSGHVRTADGQPLPAQLKWLKMYVRSVNSSYFSAIPVAPDGSFEDKHTPSGQAVVWVQPSLDGPFAPVISSPVTVGPDGKYPPVELVLSAGFSARVRLVNSARKAIANAAIELGYRCDEEDPYNVGPIKLTSDADGTAVVAHAIDQAARLKIRATGYQEEEVPLRLSPEKHAVITLHEAHPTTGLVRDAATGELITETSISFIARQGLDSRFNTNGEHPWSWGFPSQRLTTTDNTGHFALTELRDDCTYRIYVSHPKYASQLLVIKAGQALNIALESPQPITLEVRADPGGMPREVDVRNSIAMSENSYTEHRITLPVTVDEQGVGRAVLANPPPSKVTFQLLRDSQSVTAQPGKDAVVSMDLRAASKPPTRPVIIRITVPQNAPPAAGTLGANIRFPANTPAKYHDLKITNNEARMDAPVPCQFGFSAPTLLGYRVAEKSDQYDIPASDEPFVITLEAQPAGAIHGRVTGPDGKPWEPYFYASLITVQKSPDLASNEWNLLNDNVNSRLTSYLLSPVPLNGRYRVACSAGAMFAISDEIVLDAEHPIADIPLTFAPGVTVSGTLRNPDNTPAINIELTLSYEYNIANSSSSFNSSSIRTDREGRFAFEHVNPELSIPGGYYNLRVTPGLTTQGILRKITPSQEPLSITLETGHVIRGTATDSNTGKPLANVRILAWPVYNKHPILKYLGCTETTTNAKGEFEFRNLENISFSISVQNHYPEDSKVTRQPDGSIHSITLGSWPTAKADQAEPVIIRAILNPSRQ
ncbi:MAG: hypothetical protein FWD61_02005 [Phycisphaerales bacterium]|nr:hypothetical protein [Phycisphaerales bacterium]